MKNLLLCTISFLFSSIIYSNIDVYYVENVVTIQNGKKFDYIIDYKLKTYNLKENKFSDTDICTACKTPLKLVKAPLEKWVLVLEYKISDSKSKELRDSTLEKLRKHFNITPIKKDSNSGNILAYYQVKRLALPKKVEITKPKIKDVKILQANDTHSPKIIIPPNDNFVLLKSMALTQNKTYIKSKEIKLSSSCGKLKIKDSTRFSFTFFKNEQTCSIYAKLGAYMDIVEVIKLNKDGSMPSSFNILYKTESVDKINIDYYTFKTKGIILKSDSPEDNKKYLKWINKDKNLRLQIIKDGIMLYPKKKLKKYNIELIDIKKGISDKVNILIKE